MLYVKSEVKFLEVEKEHKLLTEDDEEVIAVEYRKNPNSRKLMPEYSLEFYSKDGEPFSLSPAQQDKAEELIHDKNYEMNYDTFITYIDDRISELGEDDPRTEAFEEVKENIKVYKKLKS